ncbi:hypothetical protein E4U21_003600 [Claviceps maximensis]|nr:hypothetical protein E4U21_003600 [Claviceps maximensis]
MESTFLSQDGHNYLPEEALEHYPLWSVDPWPSYAQTCDSTLSYAVKIESSPCAAEETRTPWICISNPETPMFTPTPTEQTGQSPIYCSTPVPDRARQAPMRPRHDRSIVEKKEKDERKGRMKKTNAKAINKDNLLDKPIAKRLSMRRSNSLSSAEKSSSAEDCTTKDKEDVYQERSRMASNKFRARKRSEIAQLEMVQWRIEGENRTLRSVLDALTSEIHLLKMQILQHTNCDCELIQEYIRKGALNFVQNLEMASP